MKDFTKIVRIGTLPSDDSWRADYSVYVKIDFKDGNLSLTGVEGPTARGNARGSCGQIRGDDLLNRIRPADGWDKDTIKRLFDIWEDYHLNNIQAGTPTQTAYLKANPVGACRDHYQACCNALGAAGLLFESYNGKIHTYGHAWLKIDVPADVLDFLKSLPDTDRQPAWC